MLPLPSRLPCPSARSYFPNSR